MAVLAHFFELRPNQAIPILRFRRLVRRLVRQLVRRVVRQLVRRVVRKMDKTTGGTESTEPVVWCLFDIA